MNNNHSYKEIESLKVVELFKNDLYRVPVYQRGYDWEQIEIERLLQDIMDNKNNVYYIGTLIVSRTSEDNNRYDIIDGQQRLTTLFLLFHRLGMEINNKLDYEIRENDKQFMFNIEKKFEQKDEDSNLSIGYKYINNYFKINNIDKDTFKKQLEKVEIIRIIIPKDIGLNKFFETMNSRGEQLEKHQIFKAYIIEHIKDNRDKQIAALIWDACSILYKYVETNFPKEIRTKLFNGKNDSGLCEDLRCNNHNSIDVKWEKLRDIFDTAESLEYKTLTGIINEIKDDQEIGNNHKSNKKNDEDERFSSIIEFPFFLLHVDAVFNRKDEKTLNENNMLKDDFKKVYREADKAREFILAMLECRLLYDRYIIKQDYSKENNRYILKKYKVKNDTKDNPYINTFENQDENDKLKYLEYSLRITYTSQDNMHWITKVLKTLWDNKDNNGSVINTLENFCRKKVRDSNYENKSGFDIQRIVLTYLDYLLYCNWDNVCDELKIKKKFSWDLKFRNSIEHLYPQNPRLDDKSVTAINNFGNLAFITLQDNIKISNSLPKEKCEYMTNNGSIMQSPKLYIMSKLVEKNKGIWDDEIIEQHKKDMFDILSDDIKKLETGG